MVIYSPVPQRAIHSWKASLIVYAYTEVSGFSVCHTQNPDAAVDARTRSNRGSHPLKDLHSEGSFFARHRSQACTSTGGVRTSADSGVMMAQASTSTTVVLQGWQRTSREIYSRTGSLHSRVRDVVVVHHFGCHTRERMRPLQQLQKAFLKLLRKPCTCVALSVASPGMMCMSLKQIAESRSAVQGGVGKAKGSKASG